MPNVRVGDVDLQLFLPLGNWDYLYPPAKCEVEARVTFSYCTTPHEDKEPIYEANNKLLTMYWPIDIDERPLSGEYALRRNVAFLAGIISKKYWFIHAAGFKYKSKGIVLIGKSGHGKSTLLSLFDDAQVLDEDLLFTDGNIMKRVSNIGTKNNASERLSDDIREHIIDYVFLLNNQKDPNFLYATNQSTINHEITFDDRLPDSFFSIYAKKPLVPFSCPVYEIGTKSNPQVSKKIIESVIDS